jgi:hypothetical protein
MSDRETQAAIRRAAYLYASHAKRLCERGGDDPLVTAKLLMTQADAMQLASKILFDRAVEIIAKPERIAP